MPNIKITVTNKRAAVVGSPVIVCGNSDYTVTFTFDEEWSGLNAKTARFVYVKDGEVQHEDVVFAGNTAAVPVLSNVTFVKVGVFAGDLCTTTPARILCDTSILCGSGAPQAPTPDVYNQIIALLEDLERLGQLVQIDTNKINIESILSGEKTAGNAAKLAGNPAEYYATAADLESVEASVVENLIDLNMAEAFVRGTGTYLNNCAIVNRNVTEGASYYCRDFNNLEVGKEYTVSADFETSDSGGCFLSTMYVFDNTGSAQSFETLKTTRTSGNQGKLCLTFVPVKESSRIRVAFYITNNSAVNGATATFSNMQLEEGPEAHPYVTSKFSKQQLRKDINESVLENLIPFPYYGKTVSDKNGIAWTVSTNGTLTATGKASETLNSDFTIFDKKKFEAGTYSISGIPSGCSGSTYHLFLNYYENGSYSKVMWLLEDTTFVLTQEDVNKYTFVLGARIVKNTSVNNLTFRPVLVKGDTIPDEYIPYSKTKLTIGHIVDHLLSTASDLPVSARQAALLYAMLGGLSFVPIAKSDYDALATKDNNTVYLTYKE